MVNIYIGEQKKWGQQIEFSAESNQFATKINSGSK